MGGIVSLVRVQNSKEIRNSISKALDLIEFKLNKSISSAVIKPNLCYYWDTTTGYTTSPKIVAGIIDWIRERFGADIDIKVAEADATAMRTRLAFSILGYEKLAKEKKIELFNLTNGVSVQKSVQVNGCEIEFRVPQLLLESDFFIDVPKLKVMKETCISCAMKNIFGCITSPRKIVYHPILNEAIVGISNILRPDLTIVDGLVALGRFPIKLNLVMAGTDPFQVDWIACQIMGYNPHRVKFLTIAIKEKMEDPRKIMTRGESINSFKRIFPKEHPISLKRSWHTQLALLRAYSKIVDDIIPPILE